MIAFLISNIAIRGGTTKQFLYLIEYAEKKGINFKVITQELDFEKTYPGFKKFRNKIIVIPLVRKKNYIAKIYFAVKFILKVKKVVADAQIVNFHDGSFASCLPVFKNKKVVWQINDLPYFFNVGVASKFKLSVLDKLFRFFIIFYKSRISAITVNVTKNADRVFENLGVKAHVFYCGIEPLPIKHDQNQSFSNFKKKKINLLTSGLFFPYRNYETQIELVKIMLEKGYDVTLKIIGSTTPRPEYTSKIVKLIEDNNLQEHITICGQVDEKMFVQLHEEADFFLFINVDQSWGLAVFEAMSCGLPVFVSKSVGATEILEDGVNAIFVDPLDSNALCKAILNYVHDENAYKAIVKKAMYFHKDYTWEDSYSKKMIQLMQGL